MNSERVPVPKNHIYRECKECEFWLEQGPSRCKLGFGKALDDTGLDGKCYIEIAYERGWKDREEIGFSGKGRRES